VCLEASRILASALVEPGINRRTVPELSGFLGLAATLSMTDLIVTLPRHTAETHGHSADLPVFLCPFSIHSFSVTQY
jgi:hypothetical protein